LFISHPIHLLSLTHFPLTWQNGGRFDDNVYFPPIWEGKTIDFQYDDSETKFFAYPSKLGKKLYEKCRLVSNRVYKKEKADSEAEAMFKYTSTQNDNYTALMLIYMQ
jgi:hypothetical protein